MKVAKEDFEQIVQYVLHLESENHVLKNVVKEAVQRINELHRILNIKDCPNHLENCDEDGYCNQCGHQ